jgi:methionyl-tRNA synthetase
VLARWRRQRGERVWFLADTDEHGQKILRTAEANRVTPNSGATNSSWRRGNRCGQHLNIADDDFIRY